MRVAARRCCSRAAPPTTRASVCATNATQSTSKRAIALHIAIREFEIDRHQTTARRHGAEWRRERSVRRTLS